MKCLENKLAALCAVLLLAAGQGWAETALWSDNFETNTASHWTTGSIWKIGAPTAGPAKTHSGTQCAATGLTANVPANADAWFICTNYDGASTLTIPATNQFPRLRFSQWFDYVNAEGYVGIKESGSTSWQTISVTNLGFGNTPNYSSGVWSRPSIDLSAFAGTRVQIAFHFISGANYGGDPGWYIDDVAVVTNAPVFNNPEGFEGNFDDWSVDSGTWEIGKPASGPNAAHGGSTNCAGTVLAGNYGWNVDTRLISPLFTVPASNAPTLRYAQWFNFVNALGFVEINNGAASSINITNTTIITNTVFSSLNTNTYQLSGALVAGYTTPFYWNQTIGGWTNATRTLKNVLDLSGDVPQEGYYYEAGTTPLYGGVNIQYVGGITPLPQFAVATNFLAWQGMTWTDVANNNDTPVGYFGTNYSYTYTTNTTVITTTSNWQPLSTTNLSFGSALVTSGGWTNAALDLSGYAGQTVQVAFHFTSGASGYGTAPGWYVDDILVTENPELAVPDTQTIYAGQTLIVTNFATNSILTNDTFIFSLPSPSTNYWIDANNGVLTWTNTGIKNGILTWTNNSVAPGTNVIYVKVTDTTKTNYGPLLATTNSFQLIFLPPPAPVLTVPTTLIIPAGQTLKTNISVTNTYLPSSKFTFSLSSAVPNASITTDGVLTWTTTTTLPGTNVIGIKVADNSIPALAATNSFSIIVLPSPTLTIPTNQTLHAGQTLTVTNFVTDGYWPNSAFTFSLPSPSTNVSITADGVLTWTNTGIQNGVLTWTNNSVSPGTNTVFVMVTDNSTPPMSATNHIDFIFLPPLPPTLTVPTNQAIYAGQTLIVTNYATNSLLPSCTLTFATSGPTNMDVSNLPTNGVLRWATTTAQPAGTYTNLITVTDNSRPPLGATNRFTIVISNPPPPVLTVPSMQAIYVGQTLMVTNHATNSVFPNCTFTYSLVLGPANMDVSNLPANGVLKWTPTAVQAPGLNSICVMVTDNNTPPLSAINCFSVLVLPPPAPTITVPPAQAVSATNGFQFTLNTQPNITWRIDASSNLLNWQPVLTNVAGTDGLLQFTDLLATNFPQRFYRAVFP